MFGAAKRDKAFKDYCLILQVHPEADAAMVDAAYWHLAKRYNEAAGYDPKAKAKLEELNEAYIVLGSAERREAYMKIRVQVLGEGTLPQAPRPAPSKPPLTVMSRQQPRERERPGASGEQRGPLLNRKAAGVFVLLGLVGVTLAATTSLAIAVTVVGGALAATVALVVAVAGLPRLRLSLPRAGARSRRPQAQGDPLDSIKLQADQLRRIAGKPEDAPVDVSVATDVDADQLYELDLAVAASPETAAVFAPPDGMAEEPRQVTPPDDALTGPGHDQFAGIKRQAAAFRRIAESQRNEPELPQGDIAQNDPDQLAKIKQQTERLRNIAAKFNAAKGSTKPDSKSKD